MNIPYDSYRVFTAVVRCGSVTRAAESLRMNQPNVSRCIRNLESALGTTLFLRSSRGVTLTERGKALYSHTSIAVEQLEKAEAEFLEAVKTVSLAVTETALRCFLLPILETFRGLCPDTTIHLSNLSSTASIEAVRQGSVSLGIISGPVGDIRPLQSSRICAIRDVCICGDCFPELWDREVSLRELTAYPLLSLGRDTLNYELYRGWFADHGLSYEPRVDAATLDLVLPMVRSRLGIGFVPEDFLSESTGESFHVLRLREECPQRELLLLEHPELRLSASEEKLKKLILESETVLRS